MAHRLSRVMALPVAGILAATVAVPSIAAEPAKSPNSSRRPVAVRFARDQQWYGQPILVTDGLGLLLFGSGVAIQRESLRRTCFIVGATSYALGSPFVHVSNGQPSRSVMSGGMRLIMPAALAGIAHLIADEAQSSHQVRTIATIGAAANGMVVAVIIDQIALAHRPVPTGDAAIVLIPRYEPQQRLAMLSVGGTW